MSQELAELAPDHALLCRAMVAGVARWEPFDGRDDSGEVCVNGLRYTTDLDQFGVPVLTRAMRISLVNALGGGT